MKTYLILFLFCYLITLSGILAQDKEIFVINESNITFAEFFVKGSQNSDWISINLASGSQDFFQSFTILPNTVKGCIIDFKAVDESGEYLWEKIDACNAIEISLYFEDDGTSGYTVTHEEPESEDDEDFE
jgi:hypothetical protein